MAEARPRRPRATKASEPAASAPEEPAAEGAPAQPLCSITFCPVCMAVTALGDARPELIEHLLVASRELLLAMRALIDVRLEGLERHPEPKIQRITID